MTSIQKIIKYGAIAFAIFLIVTIISSILTGIYAFSSILGYKKQKEENNSEMISTNFEVNNIKNLDIEVGYTNLIIKNGDTLRVDTDNKYINFKQNNGILQIKENTHRWFFGDRDGNLTLYIPNDLQFDKIEIKAGAGRINMDNLTTEDLSLELGAGETQISKLIVSNRCNIEGGAGKINIEAGVINDLDVDLGVGETNIIAALLGKTDIDAGVGNLDIKLLGNKDDYKIKVEKGIGTIRIGGQSIDNNQVYGDGKNDIKIDGGIGNIDINF